MARAKSDATSYWSKSATFPVFAKLADDATADVVIVGGGITGLTAAYLLAKARKRVILLERGRCAAIDTGHTSAHLTMVTDASLSELAKAFGRTHAQAAWDAGLAAIAKIDDIIHEHDIDAGFKRVDGYLHTPCVGAASDQPARLEADAKLAAELGFDAEYLQPVPLVNRPGVRFADQARIHPRKYLAALAKTIVSLGGRIHEYSEVDEFCNDPRRVMVDKYTVRCEDVVVATHNPIVGFGGMVGATLFQTKLALYTSYVISGAVARGVVPDALWWDTADPYQFVRIDPRRHHDVIIFGGEDHKTGQEEDTEAHFRRLENHLRAIVPSVEVEHRWSGQVIETPDDLPYIGQSADHQYSATGYAGNGLTFGTLAGMLISDALLGRSNPWTELFDPGRKAITRGLWDYVKENADYPYYLIRDRLSRPDSKSLRAVKRGQAMIIDRNGAKVAAYRDKEGAVTLRSAVCTHMGCQVVWNPAEQTWDCPCHGSRFTPTGEVISGPAEAPLPEAQ